VSDEISTKLYEAIEPASRPTGDDQEHGRAPLERLYITGHSLGAAMAVLAAAKIAIDESPSLRHRLHGVYTFGQPAVGDTRFATQCKGLFGDRLYRHIYAADVVPCLPPAWDGRFVHFGEERVARMPFPVMGSEDFSYVLQRVPGVEAYVGATPEPSDPREVPQNHSNKVVLDESALAAGVALYAAMAERLLERGGLPATTAATGSAAGERSPR
jgi:metal-dependent amidase/aminoacylase/carboxypeptidase family protein